MAEIFLKKYRIILSLLGILLFCPLYLHAETISFYTGDEIGQKELQELVKQNPLGPQENIKATLIHKTEDVSIHLIQIRFKEKPHIHKTHDLIVSLKNGKGVLHIAEKIIIMSEGDSAFIPRDIVHYFENSGEDVAVGVGIFIPSYDGTDMELINERGQ